MGLGTGLLAASGGGPYQNLNQRLAQGIQGGQGAYQGALDRAQATAMAGQGYEMNQLKMQGVRQDQARQQQIMQGREQIIAANPMPDSTDSAALASWIDRVLPSFIRIGDTETLGKLSEIRKSIEPKDRVATVNLGDRTQFYDPRTGQPIREERQGQGPGTLKIATEMTPVQQERLWSTTLSNFRQGTKDYVKAAEAWGQVDHVLQRARSGAHSPDDIIQLIDGISRLNNPGAVVRVGTVNIQLQKIGSLEQKLRMWVGRGARGAWPTDIVEGIARAAREIASEHEKQYSRLRENAKARGEHLGLPSDYIDASLPNHWLDGVRDTPTYTGGGDGSSTGRPSLDALLGGGQ
jgi:hypothetical protein